jgi:hypothetical protein
VVGVPNPNPCVVDASAGRTTFEMRTSPVSARRARKVLSAALLAGLLVAAACTKDKPADDTRRATTTESPATTTTPESTTSTTTTPATTTPSGADPTKVPGDVKAITPAYAEAVLGMLLGRLPDATAAARKDNTFERSARIKLYAIFAPGTVANEISDLQGDDGPSAMAASPGKVEFRVDGIEDVSADCILVSTSLNIAKLLTQPAPTVDPFFMRLERQRAVAPSDTPWRIGPNHGGRVHPEDRCNP